MSEETPLIPVEEKTVDFYGDTITAALVEVEDREEVYVPLRPICDYLGLSWRGQRERVERDEVLREVLKGVRVTRTPSDTKRSSGGPQEAMSLPLKFLPGWLFGIDTNRVKPELKDKIIRYRRECYDVLWRAFQEEALTSADTGLFDTTRPPAEPSAELVQIREMALSIARMAQAQIELEQGVKSAHDRLDRAAQVVGKLDRRLTRLENTVLPGAIISEAQASVISTSVKALAEYLSSKEPGKNHYQGIFSELYRRFRVSDYHHIRQADYPQVLTFLNDWQQAAGGKGISVQSLLPLDEPEENQS